YRMGDLINMGPGMFPLMLGGIFAVLGLGVILEGRRADTTLPEIPYRPILAVSAATIAFGFTITRFGLLPALSVMVLLTALSERPVDWKFALITIAVLSITAVVALFLLPTAFNLRLFAW